MCYCYPVVTNNEVLRDIVNQSIPDEALVCTHCWTRICRVRGLNFSSIDGGTWREICAQRGYLFARENPRGF
jgi:hypothetical protein